MKKFFKRFGAAVFAIALCFTMNTAAMAAKVAESEGTDAVSPRATTVGTVIFSGVNAGNGTGSALKPSWHENVTFSPSAPNRVRYIVQSNGNGNSQCQVGFDDQLRYSLTCDGKAHVATIGEKGDFNWALSANKEYTCKYNGVNFISISLVFYRE